MPVEVILPKVDMDMTHGTVAVWHVAEGDLVEKGAALFDIETDKAAMEVEAPASGRLTNVTARPGDKVPVGTVVAWLVSEGEAAAPPVGSRSEAVPTEAASTSDAAEMNAKLSVVARPVEVILPKVDMDMTHGTISAWHIAEGQRVQKGVPLFDIETDKAAMEVEAPETGLLQHVTARPGERIAVGAVVAYIYPEGVALGPAPAIVPGQNRTPETEGVAAASPASVPAPQGETAIVADIGLRATPAARAAARGAGIEIGNVIGTGPKGRIQRGDVEQHSRMHSHESLAAPLSWTPERRPLSVTHRHGEGAPLVLIHGFASDSQSWAPLEKALQCGNPIIRIDLPGHGRSPRRKIGSFADLARMMVEAFDEATSSIGQVHIVGHSLGGALAIAIADTRVKRVASLSLLAPAGLGPEIDADALNGIVRATKTESLAPWLRRLTATPEGVSDDYARAAMRLRSDPQLRLCQADMAGRLFPDGVQAFDLRPAVNRLTAPIALLWGRQDHILPYRHSLAIDGDLGIHLLKHAGHVPQIECPERVAKIIGRHIVAAGASG